MCCHQAVPGRGGGVHTCLRKVTAAAAPTTLPHNQAHTLGSTLITLRSRLFLNIRPVSLSAMTCVGGGTVQQAHRERRGDSGLREGVDAGRKDSHVAAQRLAFAQRYAGTRTGAPPLEAASQLLAGIACSGAGVPENWTTSSTSTFASPSCSSSGRWASASTFSSSQNKVQTSPTPAAGQSRCNR